MRIWCRFGVACCVDTTRKSFLPHVCMTFLFISAEKRLLWNFFPNNPNSCHLSYPLWSQRLISTQAKTYQRQKPEVQLWARTPCWPVVRFTRLCGQVRDTLCERCALCIHVPHPGNHVSTNPHTASQREKGPWSICNRRNFLIFLEILFQQQRALNYAKTPSLQLPYVTMRLLNC